MDNAFGDPQTIVLFGGSSEIGQAIVRRFVTPATGRIVLAGRTAADMAPFAAELTAAGVDEIDVVDFDAAETAGHGAIVFDLAARHGDLDLVVLAFGVLGDQAAFDADPAAAADAVQVNFGGAVSTGLAVAAQLRRQGHGRLIVLSSVAGERVRKANFVYGSTKAGLDGFAQGLGDSLDGSGAHVLVVRPGFVRTRMTEGLDAAPFSTTPEEVARLVERAVRSGRRVVWTPGLLRVVFAVFRHLPGPIWRRLPI